MQRFVYNRFTTSCAANRRRLGNVATELYWSADSGGVGGHWALLVNAAFSSVAGRVCAKTEIRLISACQRPREEGGARETDKRAPRGFGSPLSLLRQLRRLETFHKNYFLIGKRRRNYCYQLLAERFSHEGDRSV